MKCKPHDWYMPVVGDDWMTCGVCGKQLEFVQTTPNMMASIVNAQERKGWGWAEEFKEAYFLAAADASRRYVAPLREPHPFKSTDERPDVPRGLPKRPAPNL